MRIFESLKCLFISITQKIYIHSAAYPLKNKIILKAEISFYKIEKRKERLKRRGEWNGNKIRNLFIIILNYIYRYV